MGGGHNCREWKAKDDPLRSERYAGVSAPKPPARQGASTTGTGTLDNQNDNVWFTLLSRMMTEGTAALSR